MLPGLLVRRDTGEVPGARGGAERRRRVRAEAEERHSSSSRRAERARDTGLHRPRNVLSGVVRRPDSRAEPFALLLAGARPSEAAALTWDHVDLRQGIAYIEASYHYGAVCDPKTRA